MTDPLAHAAMVAHCGWDPTEVVNDRTVLLNGTGTNLLTLPSLHVTDVSAVVISDGRGDSVVATVGPAPADVQWDESGCLTYAGCQRFGVWPAGQRNIAVTYSGGYDPVPADLQAALNSIGKRTDRAGIRSRTMGKSGVTYFDGGGLSETEEMVLNRYRIIAIR